MYFWRSTVGPVDLAFTDRFGGVSGAPYDELNLARASGDDPAAVRENWARVTADFAPGSTLNDMDQVHGADVRVVRSAGTAGGGPSDRPPACDALVTALPGVTLAVRVADCVPVLLADAGAGVIAAVHSGRPGLVLAVATAAVHRMRELGAVDITAWIGPHVCGRCYEVPAAMAREVAGAVPEAAARTSWGTPALDIGAGVRAQLEAAGCGVVDASACTLEDTSLYSYRRDGDGAGRFAGLVRRRV